MRDGDIRWALQIFTLLLVVACLIVILTLNSYINGLLNDADDAARDIDALQAELAGVTVELNRIETAWCGNGILYVIDDDGDFDRCMEQWGR